MGRFRKGWFGFQCGLKGGYVGTGVRSGGFFGVQACVCVLVWASLGTDVGCGFRGLLGDGRGNKGFALGHVSVFSCLLGPACSEIGERPGDRCKRGS